MTGLILSNLLIKGKIMAELLELTIDACIKEAFDLGAQSQQQQSILSPDSIQQHQETLNKRIMTSVQTELANKDNDFMTLARLSLDGSRDDVKLFIHRMAKRIANSNPDASAFLTKLRLDHHDPKSVLRDSDFE